MRQLDKRWHDSIYDLVRLVAALNGQDAIARDLRSFSQAVNEIVRASDLKNVPKLPCDLVSVIISAVRAVSRLSSSRVGIDLADVGAETLCAEVRQADILVAWLALLSNAIDAARSAGSAAWVGVRTERRGNDALISIANNGDAVPKAYVPILGKESFTTKPGGNGLGLVIAYDLVEANGGRVEHCYADGKTSFTTALPLLQTAALIR